MIIDSFTLFSPKLFAALPFSDPELKNMSRDFHAAFDNPLNNPIAFVILGGVIVLALVALYVYKKKNEKVERKIFHDEPALLKELCQAHQLNRLETMAVKELAQVRGITPSGKLFIEPDAWTVLPEEKRLQSYRAVLVNVKNRVFAQ